MGHVARRWLPMDHSSSRGAGCQQVFAKSTAKFVFLTGIQDVQRASGFAALLVSGRDARSKPTTNRSRSKPTTNRSVSGIDATNTSVPPIRPSRLRYRVAKSLKKIALGAAKSTPKRTTMITAARWILCGCAHGATGLVMLNCVRCRGQRPATKRWLSGSLGCCC